MGGIPRPLGLRENPGSIASKFITEILKVLGKLPCNRVLNITYKIMCTPSTKCTEILTLLNGQLKISKSFSIKGTKRLNFQYYARSPLKIERY